MFQGDSVQLRALGNGRVELCFDRRGEAINKLDARTVDEFRQACALVAADASVLGLLVTSAKDVFIVGADITEFGKMFELPGERIATQVRAQNEIFIAFEDLAIPSVIAINGYALGGGLELALAGALRVMSRTAQVGVPEVKLGLFPGFGGTVRLSRLAGVAVACDWVTTGQPAAAEVALAVGAVDELADPTALRDAALSLLSRCIAGTVDWRTRQQLKRVAVPLAGGELQPLIQASLEDAARLRARHQPAAAIAVEMMSRAALCDRAGALNLEAQAFGRVAKTQAAAALVQTFLNEQAIKKLQRRHVQQARPVTQAAVLGAGIMGGGIAYASALAGVPVRLKDIAAAQLDLGVSEAAKQLARRVRQGRLTQAKADAVLASIQPQLNDEGFAAVDLVVEAVVERLEVKQRVLAALEPLLREDALIASNTSSLRIDDIAAPLRRPELLVGLHFFNPVPQMPLVEVVRGSRSSEGAVASAVAYAVAMRKTPIVVKDGPGFLVNRILTPYINAFVQLVADGADFEQVDRVMEAFGWPMGPAYLQDVVGMDTGSHVGDVISAGYPARMPPIERHAVHLMVQHGRLGQKIGVGFYRYERDPQGKPRKLTAPEAHALMATLQPQGLREFSDGEIVDRMMLPLLAEAIQALSEGVVSTPAELDMALLLGIGFPAYLGGPLKYADWLGPRELLARFERYGALGAPYVAPALLRTMAAHERRFYPL